MRGGVSTKRLYLKNTPRHERILSPPSIKHFPKSLNYKECVKDHNCKNPKGTVTEERNTLSVCGILMSVVLVSVSLSVAVSITKSLWLCAQCGGPVLASERFR